MGILLCIHVSPCFISETYRWGLIKFGICVGRRVVGQKLSGKFKFSLYVKPMLSQYFFYLFFFCKNAVFIILSMDSLKFKSLFCAYFLCNLFNEI